ncbi:uncharacterized protein F4822DRAFT_429607 [Hypoxylon trugodes]|uniref:uncharacterized protein n=1 Tax=Hypoxylon trugodes TaxID=326681 RepID=UPI00219E4747|nr:uncharacterized protein F4822DRAFT_429607 [Hypoxylon trugodes]KAI1388993.1 hypothetical protein F4822DRAFT_429607 [Hypoxylon trugodes]
MRFTNFALAAFSMGSALAAPAVHQQQARAIELLSTAITTVTGVQKTVEGDLKLISGLVVGVNVNTTTLVPQIEHTLLEVVSEVTKIASPVLSLVGEGVPQLAESELQQLPQLLNGVLSIGNGIKTTVGQVVKGVSGDALTAVKPELQLVLSIVEPIAKPVVGLVQGLLGEVAPELAQELQGLLGDVEGLLGNILAPVAGLLGGKVL